MSPSGLFTREDARELREGLVELFDAKLEGVGQRITGLRNWVVAVLAVNSTAAIVAVGTAILLGKSPAAPFRTGAEIVKGLFV